MAINSQGPAKKKLGGRQHHRHHPYHFHLLFILIVILFLTIIVISTWQMIKLFTLTKVAILRAHFVAA